MGKTEENVRQESKLGFNFNDLMCYLQHHKFYSLNIYHSMAIVNLKL